MKEQVDPTSALPSKRLFHSIIADYNLERSICELVDNALDIWHSNECDEGLEIEIELETTQQSISVKDNAGGVEKPKLKNIVAPGATGNDPEDEIIGFFGVGTKRAVVALAQDVGITTRNGSGETYRVEFDESWLEKEDDWDVPTFKVDPVSQGTTIVELQKLRVELTDEKVQNLKDHISATYAYFLDRDGVQICVNGESIGSQKFDDDWAFPPNFEPREYHGSIDTGDGGEVNARVIAGLTSESSPVGGEYGVYFYCNNRLIARAKKDQEVGFVTGRVGKPHPNISLTRVLVFLNGDAQYMPWNSSKSDINPNHHIFSAIHEWLIRTTAEWASLSRRWEGEWEEEVFKYGSGKYVEKEIEDFLEAKKAYLPPLPKSKKRFKDKVKEANESVADEKPWVRGLYEGVAAVDIISRKTFDQKNRINLILLDSTLEIGFKEYLVNEVDEHYTDQKLKNLFKRRHKVRNEIREHIDLDEEVWKKLKYYYDLRCKLIHERSTVTISDSDLEDYRNLVQEIFSELFGLEFDP